MPDIKLPPVETGDLDGQLFAHYAAAHGAKGDGVTDDTQAVQAALNDYAGVHRDQ